MSEKAPGNQPQKSVVKQTGLIVFVILIVLLILEFAVASIDVPDLLILIFAVLEAGIVLWEYMHVSRFFQ